MTAAMKLKDTCSLQKSYDQPRLHIKKQRRYFANKGLVKAMVFPVVTYGCESWTVNKAECWRTDAFKLWWWRSLLRVPWTAKRSNQPWTVIGRTDAKAETPVFWSSHGNSSLIGKVPDAGKGLAQEKRVSKDEMAGWHHWCNGMNLGKLQEMVRDRKAWHATVYGVAKSRTWLGDWTATFTNFFPRWKPR